MQFLSPLFLIGLAAVAIPVVVHLFNFRRYKKVYFSNVELLQQLQTETRKQSRLKQWLVLALRIGCIIFIVLAFAQPIIPGHNGISQAGSKYVSVYLDNSFSMEGVTPQGSKLELAKRKAHEIAAAYSATDRFQLITNDAEGRHFRFVSAEEFAALVDEVQIGPASATIADIAHKQYDFMNTNASGSKNTYLISDFQQSSTHLGSMPTDTTIGSTTLIPIQSAEAANIFVDSISLESPIIQKGSVATIYIYATNSGSTAVEKVPVKLTVDGRQCGLASIDLPAHSTQSVAINFTIDRAGTLNGMVSITDYPIVYDDQMYFSLHIQEAVNILAIDGNSAAPYLDILFGSDSAFRIDHCGERNINFDRLPHYNTVILNEVHNIPSGLGQTLLSFVSNGGTLVVIPPMEADLQSYSALLTMCNAPVLSTLQTSTAKATAVNFNHHLYQGVLDPKAGTDNIETLVTHRYYKTAQSANTIKESIIALDNGDDFLTATPLENGRIYLFATALNATCTDFAKQALFVPTLYNMALQSHPVGRLYHTIGSTNAIELLITLKNTDDIPRLMSADGSYEVIPELKNTAGKTYAVLHNQIKTAGNYILRLGDNDIQCAAFNYNRSESETKFMSQADLLEGIDHYNLAPTYSVINDIDKPISKHIQEQANGTALWKYFAIAALITLLAEILVLRFFKP